MLNFTVETHEFFRIRDCLEHPVSLHSGFHNFPLFVFLVEVLIHNLFPSIVDDLNSTVGLLVNSIRLVHFESNFGNAHPRNVKFELLLITSFRTSFVPLWTVVGVWKLDRCEDGVQDSKSDGLEKVVVTLFPILRASKAIEASFLIMSNAKVWHQHILRVHGGLSIGYRGVLTVSWAWKSAFSRCETISFGLDNLQLSMNVRLALLLKGS